MARVKVKLADNILRVVSIDPAATNGATIGTNFHLPDGSTPTLAELQTLFAGTGTGGVVHHRLLQGLTLGDDHPQYTQWIQDETITGQWQWTKSLWGPNGTAALPAFTFTADPDTGIYRVGANNLGISTGGALRWDVSTTAVTSTLPLLGPTGTSAAPAYAFSSNAAVGMYLDTTELGFCPPGAGTWRLKIADQTITSSIVFNGPNGTDATPTFSFYLDPDTGMHRSAADNLAFTTGGGRRATMNSSSITSTVVFLGPNGTAATPAFSFAGDQDTGMHVSAANTLSFDAGGTIRMNVSGVSVTAAVPFYATDGSVTAVAYAFATDPNTGLYRIGADNVGVAAGGVLRWNANTAAITSTLPRLGQDGAVGAPAYSFSGDTNTGLYRIGADNVGIATAGTLAVDIGAATAGWFTTKASDSTIKVVGVQAGGDRIVHAQNTSTTGLSGFVAQDDAGTRFITFGVNNTAMSLGVTYGAVGEAICRASTAAAGWCISAVTGPVRFITGTGGTERARFVGGTSEVFVIGHTAGVADSGGTLRQFQIMRNAATGQALGRFSADTGATVIEFLKSRNATTGSHTVVQVDDDVGAFLYEGSDGTVFRRAAAITVRIDAGTPSSTSMPGRIDFATTADGSVSATTRATIYATGQAGFSDGTAALPGTTFRSDLDTGIYRIGANNLGIAVGGANALDISTVRTLFATPPRVPSYTVAGLPAAATVGAGSLALVTDNTLTPVTGQGVAPVGGGANVTTVFSTGAAWLGL